MGIGALIGILVHGTIVALVLASPRSPRALGSLSFRLASAYNEAPFVFFWLLVIPALPTLLDPQPSDASYLGLLGLVVAGLLLIAWQGTRARPVVEAALDRDLGSGWRDLPGLRIGPPWAWILFFPFVLRPRKVTAHRNLAYGDAGWRNLLDLYHRKDRPGGAPVLIHFHSGGFYSGRKSFDGRALLFRLASRGWVTVSANYRLRPEAGFREHLADVKRVIAWVRSHASEFGGDPSTIFLAGGSAGGQLASIAALTQNDPRHQPGFEDADTSVVGVASLYGWYDGYYEEGGPESESGVLGHDPSGAPPFFVAHGRKDSLAWVESARRFVSHLRSGSPNPVVYAELPHGQHAFDLFRSFRFSAVVDGVEAFGEWVLSGRDAPTRQSDSHTSS